MKTRFYIYLILILSACNNLDNSKSDIKIGQPKTLNDSIFYNLLNCASNSKTTEMFWYNMHAVVIDDEIPGENTTKVKDDGKIMHGYLKDRNQILQFIRSFPIIKGRADTLEFIRAASDDYLTFICDKDTLLTFSWDGGRHQVYVNKQWYKIDFYGLYKQLEKIRVDKN